MSDALKCADHPNAVLVDDARAGDVICSACGVVVGDRIIDVGSEWRSFNNETTCKDPSRVGAAENPLLTGSDLSTSIEMPRGKTGNNLNIQRKTMNKIDRRLSDAFDVINEIAERGNIPSAIADAAKLLFKKASDTQLLKTKKLQSVPRTFKEIAAVANANLKDLGKAYKNIIRCSRPSDYNPIVSSIDMVDRFVTRLGISDSKLTTKVKVESRRFVRVAGSLPSCAGRSPTTIIAGCIYLACNHHKVDASHKQVGDICGAAETTVRQIERGLVPFAHLLFADGVEEDDVQMPDVKPDVGDQLEIKEEPMFG